MKTYNFQYLLILPILYAGKELPARAQDVAADSIYFSLPVCTSLGSRGATITLMRESPDSKTTQQGRHISTECFYLSKIGAEPSRIAESAPQEDRFAVGSTHFGREILSVYLTEKNETIIVTTDGLEYFVETSLSSGNGTKKTLKNFAPSGLQAPHGILKVDISGTLANRDMQITIFEQNHDDRDRAFRFKFDPISDRWFLDATWDCSPLRNSSATTKQTIGSDDKGMRASLVNQQKISPDSYLITVLVESQLSGKPGRQKAYYYFLQNSTNSGQLLYVTNKLSEDSQSVGSGTASDPSAHPTGKLLTMSTSNVGLSLEIGSNTLHFEYDSSLNKRVNR